MQEERDRIKEGNRIIAEFSGSMIIRKYHSDWNELIPVVEKIEQGDYNVRIEFKVCTIEKFEDDFNGYVSCTIPASSKISAVWHSVVKFIKWYNQQNQKG